LRPTDSPRSPILRPAAQEFDELKKAYAILTDKSTRGALDEYLE
jgi:DnaJ-class molecular chaperone